MAQWVKTLATESCDLSLIMRIHRVEGKNHLYGAFLTAVVLYAHTHMQIQ